MFPEREYCYDSHRYGGCVPEVPQIFIKKYYYDAYRRQCEPYMFSGCGSISRNSFASIGICDEMCTKRIGRTSTDSHPRPPDMTITFIQPRLSVPRRLPSAPKVSGCTGCTIPSGEHANLSRRASRNHLNNSFSPTNSIACICALQFLH